VRTKDGAFTSPLALHNRKSFGTPSEFIVLENKRHLPEFAHHKGVDLGIIFYALSIMK
jgi:hypothetical protein